MNVVKAAVGHHQDHITGACVLQQPLQDVIGFMKKMGIFPPALQFRHQPRG
jgi:hypothetical protein